MNNKTEAFSNIHKCFPSEILRQCLYSFIYNQINAGTISTSLFCCDICYDKTLAQNTMGCEGKWSLIVAQYSQHTWKSTD